MKILSSINSGPTGNSRPSDSEIRKKVEELRQKNVVKKEESDVGRVKSAMPGTTPDEDVKGMNTEKLKDALKNNAFNFSAKEREVLDSILNR